MKNLLSVCMIVKDEEEVIGRCLSSIRELADEIIIIDTGSTDSTKDIAREYTSNIFDFNWSNDFSAARNESLKHATCKWILILDADEYLNIEKIKDYRKFINNAPVSEAILYNISVVNFVGKDIRSSQLSEASVVRLFPNFKGIHFQRPIHEQLVDANNKPMRVADSPITIYHTGYLDDIVTKKQKVNRNELLFRQLEQKQEFTPYDHFAYGNECLVNNNNKKALYHFERAYKRANSTNPWRYNCAYEIFKIHFNEQRLLEAWTINENFFGQFPNYPEYAFFRGSLLKNMGYMEEAKQNFLKAFRIAERLSNNNNRFYLVNPLFGSMFPLSNIAQIELEQGNVKNVIYYLTKLIQTDPADYLSVLHLVQLICQIESEEQIYKFLIQLYPDQSQKHIAVLTNIAATLGLQSLAKRFYSLMHTVNDLSVDTKIKYAIIQQDEQRLYAALNEAKQFPLSNEILRMIVIADSLYPMNGILRSFEPSKNYINYSSYELYNKLVTTELSMTELELNCDELFEFLASLFMLKQYELFDHYVKKLQHPHIINTLANFFYSRNLYDLAIQYYQTLLQDDRLEIKSLVNLAHLHLNNGMIEDGLQFLEEAIELDDTKLHLYVLLIQHVKDLSKKEYYTELLYRQFPYMRKLITKYNL